MKQTLSARELPAAVQLLCGRGDYQGASQLVIAFMEKGYIDYGAADLCLKAALQGDDCKVMHSIAQQAIGKAPKDWRSWQMMYRACHADFRWSEAMKALDKVGALSDSLGGEYYLNRAEAFERMLMPERALEELLKLGELSDESTETRSLLLWANIKLQQKQYDSIIFELPSKMNGNRVDRYVAGALKVLGRAYDAKCQYKQAFESISKGNQIRAQLESRLLSQNAIRRRIEVFRALFTKDWVESWSPVSSPSRTPVFMLGFPRSGTTLLEQILDAHPDIQAMEEPPTMSTVLRQATSWMQAKALQSNTYPKGGDWKAQWLAVMDYIKDFGDEQVARFRQTYFDVVNQEVDLREGSLLIEKMPLDTVDIGFILRLFPEARFIVSLRHPADCVLSGHMQSFKMNDGMANFLDLDTAASFYKYVMKLLWQYEEVFDLKDRIHYVKYEDLVSDFEGESRKVLEFLGLGWDESVERYDEHARSRGTLATPSYQGVTQKIYKSSSERWRNYGQWMAPVLHHFEEAAERYGYDLTL